MSSKSVHSTRVFGATRMSLTTLLTPEKKLPKLKLLINQKIARKSSKKNIDFETLEEVNKTSLDEVYENENRIDHFLTGYYSKTGSGIGFRRLAIREKKFKHVGSKFLNLENE